MSLAKDNGSLDKILFKSRPDVSLSAYAFLFGSIVTFYQNRCKSIDELHDRLHDLGKHVGIRLVDYSTLKERGNKQREIKLISVLLFLKNTVWKTLFQKEADRLEHDQSNECIYYLTERESLPNRFVSVPEELGGFNAAAFNAGICEQFLTAAGFSCTVRSYFNDSQSSGTPSQSTQPVTYVITFSESVVRRDKQIDVR